MKETFNFNDLTEGPARYLLEECLGSGVYGNVFRAKDLEAQQRKVAIKIQNDRNSPFVHEEYRILRDFSNHPNLPVFYGVYRNVEKSKEEIWFVMELCEGGPVIDLVNGLLISNRRMAEDHIAIILKEVVKAIIYLHENKILHRDIRGSNILLSREGEVKLVDFGLSRLLKSTLGKTTSCIGSPSWMAPEVVNTQNDQEYEGYDNRADVWSLGITALELADGKSPYENIHPTRAMFQIVKNPPPGLHRPANWSETFNDFIQECLVKNPEHRPYMIEVLEHPFLTNIPENNYYLCQELMVLSQKYSQLARENRVQETIVNSNYLKRGQDQDLEQMQVEDLATLEELTEETILQELHNRMLTGQFATFVGDILLVLNPNEHNPYKGELHHLYRFKSRSDNAPHVYAIGDSAYQAVIHHEASQHILLTGESSSGKTTNYLHLLDHLLYLGQNKNVNHERIKDGVKLLHSFIHASTPTNNYSTRCMFNTEIVYGSSGKVSGARFEINQIEKWRVSSTDMDQSNFHILHYFYDSIQETEELEKYKLKKDTTYRYLRVPKELKRNHPINNQEENIKNFNKILEFFLEFQFTCEQTDSIFNSLAAIINLGEVKFYETPEKAAEIENEEYIQNIASLLQINERKIGWALKNYCVVNDGIAMCKKHSCEQARNARDVVANNLYSRVVQYVVNLINHKLAYGISIFGGKYTIKIFDMYGFECFKQNELPQFLINATNELLQYFYVQRVFALEALETNEENIPYRPIYYYNNKEALDEMVGKSGLLNLVDKSSKQGKNAKYVIERLQNQSNVHINKINGTEFCVDHYTGKVTYDSKEMPDQNKDFLPPDIIEVLRSSTDPIIRMFFCNNLNKAGNLCVSFGEHREKTDINNEFCQIRKMRSAAGIFNSYCIELLKELSIGSGSGTHFIRCIRSDLQGKARNFHKEIVKQQIRAMAVLETVIARQQGFPCRISFAEFLRRYKFLAFDFNENVETTKENCRLLLVRLKMEGWAIGKTKVFLKYYNEEYLSRLYETQVKKIIKIQAMIRSYLSRRKYAKNPTQKAVFLNTTEISNEDKAASIVQKAYRKYSAAKQSSANDFDENIIEFIRVFYKRWRTKSIFQVLLQYRAARFQDVYNLSQQIHLYNQNVMTTLQPAPKINLNQIDEKAQVASWLTDKKPAVLKLPFRLNEIPYFDTSYMCESSTVPETDKEEEPWDAAFKWRESVSSQITSSILNSCEQSEISSKNQLIELPYNRNPEEPIRYLSSPVNDYEEEKQDKSDVAYKTIRTSSPKEVYTSNAHINNNTTSANNDFQFIRPPPSPELTQKNRKNYMNPIAELLETQGARTARRNSVSDDEPPFNFQAMLRKTNFQRASTKRDEKFPEYSLKKSKGSTKEEFVDSAEGNQDSDRSRTNNNQKDSKNILRNKEIKERNGKEEKQKVEEMGKYYVQQEDQTINLPAKSKKDGISSKFFSTTEILKGVFLEGTVWDL